MGSQGAEREVRIAIVMYGGTSLAIYMNGIAQEFLQLVRATSPAADASEAMSSTARVYRKLAHVLAGQRLGQLDDATASALPKVRFVIDILSGTSAGGINAVMLAKALVRNADLAPLKELWLEQGALERLINDPTSGTRRTPYREPVRALFNSDHMYVELLKAFDALNRPDEQRPSLVGTLDLVVTGTDLSGEPIDIRLADGVAQEFAHKHAFRFRYAAKMIDEFKPEHDPLLAFAARSTSSLPAAFEPAVAETAQALAGRRYEKTTDWRLLFRSLRDDSVRDDDVAALAQRAFADGGYLDNKPFGHAIDLLAKSAGSVGVIRKLYYLEPQPQRIDPDAPPAEAPNALANTLQVFSLARYETIRADIQRLNERNRLIDRIRTLDAGVIEDLKRRRAAVQAQPELERTIDLAGANLSDLVIKYGPAYGGYHRLRVATTTDAIANAIADHAQVPAESDMRRALRFVVRAWRQAHFRRERSGVFATESAFLRRFDLHFHRRRARFLLAKVNDLFTFDEQTAAELQNLGPESNRLIRLVDEYRQHEQESVQNAWEKLHNLLRVGKLMAQRAVHAVTAVAEVPELAMGGPVGTGPYTALPEQAFAGSEVLEALRDLFLTEGGEFRQHVRDELLAILGQPSEEESELAAERFYLRRTAAVLNLANVLEREIGQRIRNAEDAVSDLERLNLPDELASEVRELLRTYWNEYEQFDMVQFPLIEATRIGEELSPVDIHRISPVDAEQYGKAFGDDKLKGAKFASFGAFLDQRWREHDIMWGRLDGAERLIASLLGDTDPPARDQLIIEAHLAILQEEFLADREEIRKLAAYVSDDTSDAPFDVALTRARIVRFLQARSQDLELDPRAAARDLSRLVRTTGKLSDTLTAEAKMPGVVRNTLGFAAALGSTLIDAAIPRTFWNLLASHWSSLLLLLGTVLILLGLPLDGAPRLQGALLWGVGLAGTAILFKWLRSLLWSTLSPTRLDGHRLRASALRWFGRTALALALTLVAVGTALERSTPGEETVCASAGMPTAINLGLAATERELVCALGSSVAADAGPTELEHAMASATGVQRTRSLVYVALGWLALLTVLVAVTGFTAWVGPRRWSGAFGALLAVLTAAAGVWVVVRVLLTLQNISTLGTISHSWLPFTAALTKVTLLLALASVGALIPVLSIRSRSFPLSVRSASRALVIAASLALALGTLGLVLAEVALLGPSILLLAGVVIGLSLLPAAGFSTIAGIREEPRS